MSITSSVWRRLPWRAGWPRRGAPVWSLEPQRLPAYPAFRTVEQALSTRQIRRYRSDMEIGQVLDDFLSGHGPSQRSRDGGPRRRSVLRLTEGSCRVDYDEPDQVFVVSVQRIPRYRLALDEPLRVGEMDGLQVQVTAVVVDDEVAVHLQFADDDRRRALEAEFLLLRDEALTRAVASGAEPPPDPAQSLAVVTLKLTDDLGTEYRRSAGAFGGSGTEFQGSWSFRPGPPVQARRLRVTARAAGHDAAEMTLDLPAPFP